MNEVIIKDHYKLVVTSAISEYAKDQIEDLFKRGVLHYSQHWCFKNDIESFHFFLYDIESENILFYSCVIVSKLRKLPFVRFGTILNPYMRYNNSLGCALSLSADYFKHLGFCKINVSLPSTTENVDEIIESMKLTSSSPCVVSEKYNATLQIRLKDNSIDSIYDSFSTILKKNIKSARNKNVCVKEIEFIDDFNSLYEKMCEEKSINNSKRIDLYRMFSFVKKNNCGFALGAYNDEGVLMGGVLIIEHCHKAEYLIGASSSNYRKIPISHLCLFEAIKKAKKDGMEFFDMGGYNYYSKEGDEYFSINQFKKNFTKEMVLSPQRITLVLRPIISKFYDLLEENFL